MSQEIAPRPAQLPGLATQQRAAEVMANAVAYWPDGGSKVVLRRMLRENERQALEGRLAELARELRPVSGGIEEKRRAVQALSAMFMGFPSLRNTDNQAMVSAYMLALEDLPVHAIIKACEDVARRRVQGSDPDFPPTGPRLYEVAKKSIAAQEGERVKIKKTLGGEVGEVPQTPEERERLKDKALAFAAEMRAKIEKETGLRGEAMERQMSERNSRHIENEWTRYGMEPRYADKAKTIPVSLALARMNDRELDLRCRKVEKKSR